MYVDIILVIHCKWKLFCNDHFLEIRYANLEHVLKSTQSDLFRWSQMLSEFQNNLRFEFKPSKVKQKRKIQEPLKK